MTKARKPRSRRPLAFEALEARQVLTSFGVPWPEAHDLTLSFAPDGTEIGSQTNQLFQTLDQQLPTADWQEEVLRAFQTWAIEANINIGLIADDGEAAGTLGLKQGDPRFGDVRIGAFPMARDVLAVADPYDPFVANTWVGDVFLNSDVRFEPDDEAAAYDLFSVLLHEAGHVFGLPHSSDAGSPMYEQFHTLENPYLMPADIAALRALYGARSPDAFDASGRNDSLATATTLSLANSVGQSRSGEAEADITSLDDADVFRLVVPSGVHSLAIQLDAAGLSLLVPSVTILNAAGDQVTSAAAIDPLHNDVTLSLNNVAAGDIYYVKVQSGRNDVFGIGSYRLNVDPDVVSSLDAVAAPGNSYPGNPTPTRSNDPVHAGALDLITTPGYVEHTYYETDSTLTAAAPIQTYRVRSADLGAGITNVMTVLLETDRLDARLSLQVFDDQGQLVAAKAIYAADGRLEIQVPSVQSDRDYFVKVSDASGAAADTDYEFTVDFDADAAHLETYVNDSLSGSQTEVTRTLNVLQSQQFHFVLSASDWNNPLESGVEMAIVDAGGREVFQLTAADGSTRSRDVFLNEGQYTVRFTSPARSGDVHVTFELSGVTMSEPIGPQLRDTTLEPVEAPVGTALSELSFYWLPHNAPKPSADESESPGLADGIDFGAANASMSTPPGSSFTLLARSRWAPHDAQEALFEGTVVISRNLSISEGRRESQKSRSANAEANFPFQTLKHDANAIHGRASQQSQLATQLNVGFQSPSAPPGSAVVSQSADIARLEIPTVEQPVTAANPKAAATTDSATSSSAEFSHIATEKSDSRIVGLFAAVVACLSLPMRRIPLAAALHLAIRFMKTSRWPHTQKKNAQRVATSPRQANVGQSGDWAAF